MTELMRKPRTDTIELKFIGPSEQKNKAIRALSELGFADASDSIPWREIFPDHGEKNEPGICLSGIRNRENLTQKQLSELTGIPQRHISEMENGKRPIGKNNARILAKVLNVGYRIFM